MIRLIKIIASASQRAIEPPVVISSLGVIISGQSNAGNRQNVSSLSAGYAYLKAAYPNTYYKDNNQYPTRLSYNRTSGIYGVDLGTLGVINSEFENIEVSKYFVGSMPISFFLPTGGGWAGIQAAIADIHAAGRIMNVFIFVQGEQDAIINNTSYLTNLQSLRSALETESGNPNFLFIYNQLHVDYYDGAYPAGTATVRQAHEDFQSEKNIMTNIDDITSWAVDTVHFNADTLAELGIRTGQAIMNNI